MAHPPLLQGPQAVIVVPTRELGVQVGRPGCRRIHAVTHLQGGARRLGARPRADWLFNQDAPVATQGAGPLLRRLCGAAVAWALCHPLPPFPPASPPAGRHAHLPAVWRQREPGGARPGRQHV